MSLSRIIREKTGPGPGTFEVRSSLYMIEDFSCSGNGITRRGSAFPSITDQFRAFAGDPPRPLCSLHQSGGKLGEHAHGPHPLRLDDISDTSAGPGEVLVHDRIVVVLVLAVLGPG